MAALTVAPQILHASVTQREDLGPGKVVIRYFTKAKTSTAEPEVWVDVVTTEADSSDMTAFNADRDDQIQTAWEDAGYTYPA